MEEDSFVESVDGLIKTIKERVRGPLGMRMVRKIMRIISKMVS